MSRANGVKIAKRRREEVAAALETVRAPGLRIADAARRFARATDNLEHSLWRVDPKNHELGLPFNHDYAAREFEEHAAEWAEARAGLHLALETETRDFTQPTQDSEP